MIVPVAGVEKVECNVGLGAKAAREGLVGLKVADAGGVCFFNHNRTNFLDRDRIACSQLVRYRHWINRARSLREFAQTPSNFLNQSLPVAHFFAFSPDALRHTVGLACYFRQLQPLRSHLSEDDARLVVGRNLRQLQAMRRKGDVPLPCVD
jgi:hypothetical protein